MKAIINSLRVVYLNFGVLLVVLLFVSFPTISLAQSTALSGECYGISACEVLIENCEIRGGNPVLVSGNPYLTAVYDCQNIPETPPPTLAGDFVPLVGIPGIDPDADFGSYINALYILSISLAALLAVIKIIIAGVKWMMTDIVTTKADAKKDIQGALTGLLIVISAVVILTVINPDLIKFEIFNEIGKPTP